MTSRAHCHRQSLMVNDQITRAAIAEDRARLLIKEFKVKVGVRQATRAVFKLRYLIIHPRQLNSELLRLMINLRAPHAPVITVYGSKGEICPRE